MVKYKRLPALFLILTLVLLGQLPSTTGATPTGPPLAEIEPQVLEKIEAQGQTDFFVVLRDKANLNPAYEIEDWSERGWFVYNALTRVAQRSQARVIRYLQGRGLGYRSFYTSNSVFVEAGDQGAVDALAAYPEVAAIQAQRILEVHSSSASRPAQEPQGIQGLAWNVAQINADDVWSQFGATGQGIVVANIDTGVQWDHIALIDNYRGWNGASADHNYNWWDPGPYCTPGTPCDTGAHGTHTMGTMTGSDDPGLTYNVGVAPGSEWMACLGCPSGGCPGSDLVECADFMLAPWDLSGANPNPDLRPHVVNNSWGGGSCSPWYQDSIIAWRAAGIFPAFSIGNSGSGCGSANSPGDNPEAFGTGATDSNDYIAYFSSRGPSCVPFGSEIKPEVSAPGVDVCSTVPGNDFQCAGWSGTSMASPHSAGLLALLWSACPYLTGDVDSSELLIMDTASGIADGQCGDPGPPNNVYGWGRIDALAAVQGCAASGTLEGIVTEAGSGDPIEGATVEAVNAVGGGNSATTNASGYYNMRLVEDTYDVTASAYGYYPETVSGVVIVADTTTVQDFQLTLAPTHVVSGYVTEAGTGNPLEASVTFLGTPVSVSTDPSTGFYSAEVPEGTYTMKVAAALHRTQTREVVVDHDQTQNFELELLPAILLVDDDGNGPDVRSYYTDALDALGYDYDVWDVSVQGDPTAADLIGYPGVIWFTGYPWGNTINPGNEEALSQYLDAGGRLLLSSEDYLYDYGLTGFGMNYLHIGSYSNDTMETDPVGRAGDPIGDGLGPYTLVPPAGWTGAMWTDRVLSGAGGGSPFYWQGSGQDNSTWYEGLYTGAFFRTVFFGWPLEAIDAGMNDTLDRALEWLFGFEPCIPEINLSPTSFSEELAPGETLQQTLTIANGAECDLTYSITDVEVGRTTPALPVSVEEPPSFVPAEGNPDKAPAGTLAGAAAAPASLAGSWGTGAPMSAARYRLAGVTDTCDRYFAIGGADFGTVLGLTEVYDPASDSWTTLAPMPTARMNIGAAEVGGVIYVVGGYWLDGTYLNTHEAYDIAAGTWSTKASLPTALSGPMVAALHGKVYVLGGNNAAGGMSDLVFEYDPAGDSWALKASMPTGRAYGGAVSAGGYIYVVAGVVSGGLTGAFERYDPLSDTWISGPSLNMPRMSPAVVVAGPYLYVISGGGAGGYYWNAHATVERYYLPAFTGGSWEQLTDLIPTPVVGPGYACADDRMWVAGGTSSVNLYDLNQYLDEGLACCPSLGDASWLSESPTDGTVAGGTEQDITVTFDATCLGTGNYLADMAVVHNSSGSNPRLVGVSMDVKLELPLANGWNLVSVPLTPPDSDPAQVFASIAEDTNVVLHYDGCSSSWLPWIPGVGGPLTAVNETVAFWIQTTSVVNLQVLGQVPACTTVHLCPGWNMISYPCATPLPIGDALASIAGQYEVVLKYDAATGGWLPYIPGVGGPLTQLGPGGGYWIKMTAEADWTLCCCP